MAIINQPVSNRLGPLLIERLERTGTARFDSLEILVAYVKWSGVRQLADSIAKFRENGGIVRVVAGVNNKNTSKEGLEALLACASEAFVFHDRNRSRSFHPKMYVFERARIASEVFIGSSNLTYGGLFSNTELNVHLEFNLRDDQQKREFAEIKAAFQFYANPSPCNKPLDAGLISQLSARSMLGFEQSPTDGEGSADVRGSGSNLPPLFGTMAGQRAFRPPPVRHVEVASLGRGFWKRLSGWDVSPTAAPGQMQIPIGFTEYFPPLGERQAMTGGAEQAEVFLDVLYKGGREPILVEGARAILYVPGPRQARSNDELRFTFRRRDIQTQLRRGDILEFRRTDQEDVWFEITRISAGGADPRTSGRDKFGVLRGERRNSSHVT